MFLAKCSWLNVIYFIAKVVFIHTEALLSYDQFRLNLVSTEGANVYVQFSKSTIKETFQSLVFENGIKVTPQN